MRNLGQVVVLGGTTILFLLAYNLLPGRIPSGEGPLIESPAPDKFTIVRLNHLDTPLDTCTSAASAGVRPPLRSRLLANLLNLMTLVFRHNAVSPVPGIAVGCAQAGGSPHSQRSWLRLYNSGYAIGRRLKKRSCYLSEEVLTSFQSCAHKFPILCS